MGFEVGGKTALVTGANRGIGKAIVEGLLAAGAKKVYAAVRDPDSVAALVAGAGGRVVPIEVDLEKPDTISAAALQAPDVELVVNNAGVYREAPPLADDALDAMRFQFAVNFEGLVHVARAFAPVLKRNGGGALVQLNSVASLQSLPKAAYYCASKAAAYSLTQGLRTQLAEQRTLVVSVHPGPIATDMSHDAGFGEIAESPSVVADAIIAGLAAGEFHVFPDSMARDYWAAYEGFARGVIEKPADESLSS